MPCLPKLMAALALAAVAAWLVRNRPERDPETYPVQPVDPRLLAYAHPNLGVSELREPWTPRPPVPPPNLHLYGASRN